DVQLLLELAKNFGLFLEMLERANAGDGFDAADSGGDGLLADDFQDADIADIVNVRATAEFLGVEAARCALVGNGDDAYVRFWIFIAEESEGPGSEGVFDRRDVGCDLRVVADFVVHLLLDIAEFFRVNVSKMREVKAQAIRSVERASLLDVRAKNVAQCGVNEVR